MVIETVGAASLAAWLYLLGGRGGFWRMEADSTVGQTLPSVNAPPVAAVIPARNEASVVARALGSLAAQRYPGQLRIVLVDDASDDGTAAVARSYAPAEMLTVLEGAPLPEGWTGKLWAVSQGIAQAETLSPDYLLLTDADIVHPPEALEKLVAQAEQGGYDLVSWMVALHCESPAERALVPAFVFFFLLLYPPAWIRNPRLRTAGAAGGCLLIRRQTLERIGGIPRIRGELIDDCALARAVKDAGGRVWLGLSSESRSIRQYRSFGEFGRMISRTAFTQLRYSPLLLLATLAGLALTFFAPPVAAIHGSAAGLVAWALMSLMYGPALRIYRRSLLWAPLLPLVAAFYAGATIHSAWKWRQGAGGMWKGRAQAKIQ
jgi:hopene-associated glycosyltransferase HpnB